MTKKKGMIKLFSCSFPEVDKCVKKESTSLHSLFLSWAISYWIDNCLLYCNTLNNIHKCLNPTVVLSMNNNRFFFFLYSFLQLNLFMSFTFCGRDSLQCVRRYSSQLNCSSEIFILMESKQNDNNTFRGAVLYDDLAPALSFVHHNKLSIFHYLPPFLLWKC